MSVELEQVRFAEDCQVIPLDLMQKEEGEWEVSMPLPELAHAQQYDRILRALGNETLEPLQVDDGWVVQWRPKLEWA